MFESYSGSIDDSFLSETLHLEGEITTTGMLRVAGLIDGNVVAQQLTILDTGSINGNITGNKIEIDGQVNGNIEGEIIVLGINAVVKGDIYFSQSLKTEEGADVDGYIKKAKKPLRNKLDSEDKSNIQFGKPTLVKDSEKEAI
tara:strand:- start:191 stop:619 length:429 start_codon:yes stop_codon:yes gene_type:complete